jgi:hypothetical protein
MKKGDKMGFLVATYNMEEMPLFLKKRVHFNSCKMMMQRMGR